MTAIHAKKPAIHAKKSAKIKTPSTPIVNRVLHARIIFIVTVVVLLLFGLMMVYSASSIIALREKGDAAFYFIKQIQFVGLGLVVA
ncbi:MAG: FtsW/RodA/SpoVE family cell cycle protein, partial [Coriobacteriia bacterium]|nr:FtsW/RodA/SpoVE family cell cycle protein [Coriobacteriia bacterium]